MTNVPRDASVAIAEHIAGSEGAYVDIMNQQAKLLGMKDTQFNNATGWPDESHYTNAIDMAILTVALIKDFPDHYGMYAEKYFSYNNIRQPNRNSLLWRDKSVDGVKTGHTDAAGYCLVTSATSQLHATWPCVPPTTVSHEPWFSMCSPEAPT